MQGLVCQLGSLGLVVPRYFHAYGVGHGAQRQIGNAVNGDSLRFRAVGIGVVQRFAVHNDSRTGIDGRLLGRQRRRRDDWHSEKHNQC